MEQKINKHFLNRDFYFCQKIRDFYYIFSNFLKSKYIFNFYTTKNIYW